MGAGAELRCLAVTEKATEVAFDYFPVSLSCHGAACLPVNQVPADMGRKEYILTGCPTIEGEFTITKRLSATEQKPTPKCCFFES